MNTAIRILVLRNLTPILALLALSQALTGLGFLFRIENHVSEELHQIGGPLLGGAYHTACEAELGLDRGQLQGAASEI